MSSAPGWPAWLELAQAASTFAMTGIIWLVQLVQYPGFRRVGAAEFGEFHRHHCAWTASIPIRPGKRMSCWLQRLMM